MPAAPPASAQLPHGSPSAVIGEDDEEQLRQQPGSELADFDKGRVKPRTIVSMQGALRIRFQLKQA